MASKRDKGFLSYLRSTMSQTYWLLEEVDNELVQEDLDTLEALDEGLYIPDYREGYNG